MIKLILFFMAFFTYVSLNHLSAQQAITYFLPSSNYNSAEYQDQTQAGVSMNIIRQVSYKMLGDNMEFKETLLSDNKIFREWSSFYKITFKEVYKISNNTGYGLKYYSQPICILKIPPKNGSISWVIDDGSEKEVNTSSWTTVEYLNEKRQAIKIIKKIRDRPNYSIDYYVENIGFWKSEIVSKNKVIVMDKLLRLFFKNLTSGNLISQYEEKLLSNSFKSEDGVSIRASDYRMISWSATLNNASFYTREKIEKLGFEYIKIEDSDRAHITYAYRNCSKNIVFRVTEWYNFKISFSLEWFSSETKKSMPSFFWCEN